MSSDDKSFGVTTVQVYKISRFSLVCRCVEVQREDWFVHAREEEMQRKTPLCRNFQAGSCQYGDRCKFIHAVQQQPKSNVFGSGTATTSRQQQTHNPFGFGVQNNSQPRAAEGGSRQNQFKPFENKWSRSSNGGAASARQPDNQPQASNHKCTDPEACKRIIAEDFEHERPLWKLTCYGHWKNAPCDIVGDVSYEELRAAAYDEAKRGLSMQSIVERERSMLSSKIIEFENLLRNPYTSRSNAALPAIQSPFPGTTPNTSSPAPQNSAPPVVSSFSQLGSNTGSSAPSVNAFGQAPSANAFGQAPSANAFGQAPSANAFGQAPSANAFGQAPSANAFGQAPSVNAFGQAPSANAFGQANSFSNSNQTSTLPNSSPFGTSGSFGSQNRTPTFGSPFTSNVSGFGNSGITSAKSNPFSTSAAPTQNPGSSINMSSAFSNVPNSGTNGNGQPASIQSSDNQHRYNVSGDASIWMKEKWIPGEIPEEAPPDAYVF